jgi:hypothetical protein
MVNLKDIMSQKWLDSKGTCPYCRTNLSPNMAVKCRFWEDLRKSLTSQPSLMNDTCPQHGISMFYYCKDCHECLCSDCIIMTPLVNLNN